jgi:actin-related protein
VIVFTAAFKIHRVAVAAFCFVFSEIEYKIIKQEKRKRGKEKKKEQNQKKRGHKREKEKKEREKKRERNVVVVCFTNRSRSWSRRRISFTLFHRATIAGTSVQEFDILVVGQTAARKITVAESPIAIAEVFLGDNFFTAHACIVMV